MKTKDKKLEKMKEKLDIYEKVVINLKESFAKFRLELVSILNIYEEKMNSKAEM